MSDRSGTPDKAGARFLVRLDDACPTLNRKMWREAETVLDAHDVRPVVAVIPDNLDPKMMLDSPDPNFWERVRGWQARGWGIGLHGCHHAYVTRDRGLFGWSKGSEFAGLSREEQDGRIAHGLGIFAEHGIRPDMWIALRTKKSVVRATRRVRGATSATRSVQVASTRSDRDR